MNYNDFMTMKEAANYTHIHYDRFKAMHKQGSIPYITFGKSRYFIKESLDKWMESFLNQESNQIK